MKSDLMRRMVEATGAYSIRICRPNAELCPSAELLEAWKAIEEELECPRINGIRFRHTKTGGTYRVIRDDVLVEAEGPEGSLMVVYVSESDDTCWIRPWDEFYDGRFERIE